MYPGHGKALTQTALANGATWVIAVGGDGTIGEVASGLVTARAASSTGPEAQFLSAGPRFGFLPYGTGVDVRRTYGSDPDIQKAVRALARSEGRLVDVGQVDCVDERGLPVRAYFLIEASVGISGAVAKVASRMNKALGAATYFIATLRAGLRYSNLPVCVSVDDTPEREVLLHLLSINNSPFLGGGMKIAPAAQVDDGQLDLVTMENLSMFESLLALCTVYSGRHLQRPRISHRRAKQVRVRPARPEQKILIEMDGELPGYLPAVFTILPKALLLCV